MVYSILQRLFERFKFAIRPGTFWTFGAVLAKNILAWIPAEV
jgi:hypothetical protein